MGVAPYREDDLARFPEATEALPELASPLPRHQED